MAGSGNPLMVKPTLPRVWGQAVGIGRYGTWLRGQLAISA